MTDIPEDLTALSDADLNALAASTLSMSAGLDADGWPIPHPDAIRVTAERNRRIRERASSEWQERVRDIQVREIAKRRKP
jgi:hypothetical protein